MILQLSSSVFEPQASHAGLLQICGRSALAHAAAVKLLLFQHTCSVTLHIGDLERMSWWMLLRKLCRTPTRCVMLCFSCVIAVS